MGIICARMGPLFNPDLTQLRWNFPPSLGSQAIRAAGRAALPLQGTKDAAENSSLEMAARQQIERLIRKLFQVTFYSEEKSHVCGIRQELLLV